MIGQNVQTHPVPTPNAHSVTTGERPPVPPATSPSVHDHVIPPRHVPSQVDGARVNQNKTSTADQPLFQTLQAHGTSPTVVALDVQGGYLKDIRDFLISIKELMGDNNSGQKDKTTYAGKLLTTTTDVTEEVRATVSSTAQENLNNLRECASTMRQDTSNDDHYKKIKTISFHLYLYYFTPRSYCRFLSQLYSY